ncbi:fungal-specific transcription factor domain-containing protein [Xylaria sp. FL1042]|nr:fungal-specific transcription factor domain-containing protein [Xylaria sp. FL1042]
MMECRRPAWPGASGSRACTNCQKRKSRCLRAQPTDPSCIFCTKGRKTCIFESPPDRTPLTRKNLDAAELQIAQLRALLGSLHPDMDINAAIGRLDTDTDIRGESACLKVQSSLQSRSCSVSADKPMPQMYEWHEESLSAVAEPADGASMLNDGMANLPADENSGYIGGSSGSHFLDEITSAIPSDDRTRRHSEDLHRPRPRLAVEPLLDIFLDLSVKTKQLIDNYFLFYNTCYPILHEKTFRDSIADQRRRHFSAPSRVIFYMVLAIGDWISTPEPNHAESPFYNAARSCLTFQMLESGTVETVQAFLLLGNYLQKRDRPNTGYNLVGLAWKLALGLGLHREVSVAPDTIHHERRRSLFWITYCFDNGFNITTGRPPTLSDGFVDTRTPRNINDKDLLFSSLVPPEVQYPTTYSAIIAHTGLAKIAERIYQEFLLAKTAGSKVEYQVAELMERGLNDWRRSLPSYFTTEEVPSWFHAPRAIVLWKEQNLRILLWRGSREYHSFLPNKQSAGTKCLEVSMQSIHDIATFLAADETTLHQSLVWYAVYFLFQAALVLEASYLQSSRQKREEEEASAREHTLGRARSCLAMLSRMNTSAKRCMEVLDSIHQRLRSRVTNTPDPDACSSTGALHSACIDLTQLPILAPAEGFAGGESDFGLFGSDLGFGDDMVDPTLRMLMDPNSSNSFQDMPLDMLLDNWMA